MTKQRLQKILARAGFGSRRKTETLIIEGRVTVNGECVDTVGCSADPEKDIIKVDGRQIHFDTPVYIVLNKPAKCLSASEDPRGRTTVMEYLKDVPESVFHVGRLDYDTEGILLFTNDGDYCQKVTHPRHRIYKTYEAVVEGIPGEEMQEKLRAGIELDDGPTAPAFVTVVKTGKEAIPDKRHPKRASVMVDTALLEIRIREGRKRQVRRMLRAVGHPVIRLTRTRIGVLDLGDLPSGKWRRLTPEEALRALEEEDLASE